MGTIRKTNLALVKSIMARVESGISHRCGDDHRQESMSAEDVRGYWFDHKDSAKLIQHDDKHYTIRVSSVRFLTFTVAA